MNYFLIFNGAYGRKVFCMTEAYKDKVIDAWKNGRDLNFENKLLPSTKVSFVSIKYTSTSMIEIRVAEE